MLAYSQRALASPSLRGLVQQPWTMAYDGVRQPLPGLIAPDSHIEFVFQTGAPCQVLPTGGTAMPTPRAMVFAQRHGAMRIVPTGTNFILGFRALPAVASRLLGRPLADCWDRPVDLADLIGPEADHLLDSIAGAMPGCEAEMLESWLVSRLSDWSSDDARSLGLEHRLLWHVGPEPLSQLADELGVTLRTLRRRSAKHSGLSPKQLSMSGRVLRACARLTDRSESSIADVALSVGFGDQAAFTHAFRHYVGMTPARFRAEPLVFCERPPL